MKWLKDLSLRLLANAYRVAKMLVLVAVPAALLLTHVWYQYRITQLGYKISEETERHAELVDRNRKLTIQTAVESRSDRITDLAKERFGLERVEPEQVITIDPDAVEPGETLDETEHASLEQKRAD